MKAIFSRLYEKTLAWSAHRHAPRYLAGLSFTEASFFPIPPDVMLAPMALSRPERAWSFAMITVIASVLGGIFGYMLGAFAFEPIVRPFFTYLGYQAAYQDVLKLFQDWGISVMFLASFTPIPFKLFTLTAGMANMSFLPFVLVTLVGRSARFYLVAGIVKWGGKAVEPYIVRYLDRIGWLLVVLTVIVLAFYTR